MFKIFGIIKFVYMYIKNRKTEIKKGLKFSLRLPLKCVLNNTKPKIKAYKKYLEHIKENNTGSSNKKGMINNIKIKITILYIPSLQVPSSQTQLKG